jgi:hypothetical protein
MVVPNDARQGGLLARGRRSRRLPGVTASGPCRDLAAYSCGGSAGIAPDFPVSSRERGKLARGDGEGKHRASKPTFSPENYRSAASSVARQTGDEGAPSNRLSNYAPLRWVTAWINLEKSVWLFAISTSVSAHNSARGSSSGCPGFGHSTVLLRLPTRAVANTSAACNGANTPPLAITSLKSTTECWPETQSISSRADGIALTERMRGKSSLMGSSSSAGLPCRGSSSMPGPPGRRA